MSDGFRLLDLPSQALAVQRLLGDRTDEEKLAWLRLHGRLDRVPTAAPDARPTTYLFESTAGLRCLFFLAGDRFVFFGDHTTSTVRDGGPDALR